MGYRIKAGNSGGVAPPPSGTPNFFKQINSGISFDSLLTAIQNQGVGLGIRQAPSLLVTSQTAGLGIGTFSSGEAKASQAAGLNIGSVLNMVTPSIDETGYDIVTKVYSYTGTKPIATATNVGSDDWANIANAQGNPNGSSATRVGQAFATTSAELRGQHASIPYNSDINISLVQLKFYVAQAGTVLNNGGLELAWRSNSSSPWTTLVTYAGDVDFLTTPDIYTLSGLTTWQDVDTIETKVSVTLPVLTTTLTCSCDAVVKYAEGAET
jgi:hypothetical protein